MDLAVLLGVQIGISVLFFVFAALGVGLAVFLGGLFSRLKLVGIVSASVVWVYLAVSLLVLSAFGTPVSYACISILFYGHKEERQEEIIHGDADGYQEKERRRKIRYAAEVTAHRGASVLYPENTMAAFAGAKELGADWIELDVQQSHDG